MKTRARSGMTLVEILIAMSLLSLLSVGILMAMRVGLKTMETTDEQLIRNRRLANARKIIENEIAGFIYTRAEWRTRPQDNMLAVPFVEWEARSMRFVTAYSLQDAWRGRPQIAALQVIPGKRSEGVRLIVDETPYTGPLQAGLTIAGIDPAGIVRFVPVAAGPQSFVLADRLAYCRFLYEEPRPAPPLRVWRPDWERPQLLPLGIRIDMAPLDHTPGELHVSAVTVPLVVNRDTGGSYRDAQ